MTETVQVREDITRPIIGIENRTAQEVFDIMCDRFRYAASHAEQARSEEGGWEPIETAPRDGTSFDAWVPDRFGGRRMTGLSFNRRGRLLTPAELPRWPTHWRPLPAPPTPQVQP